MQFNFNWNIQWVAAGRDQSITITGQIIRNTGLEISVIKKLVDTILINLIYLP